jgi:HEAT repeats
MGRFGNAAMRSGFRLPAEGSRLDKDQIEAALTLSQSASSLDRQLAVKNLCTCHVQADDPRVGQRLLELFGDPDPRVRGDVLHALTDSPPPGRVVPVVAALEKRYNDPDPRLRRRIRRTLTHHRRTGKLTDAPR